MKPARWNQSLSGCARLHDSAVWRRCWIWGRSRSGSLRSRGRGGCQSQQGALQVGWARQGSVAAHRGATRRRARLRGSVKRPGDAPLVHDGVEKLCARCDERMAVRSGRGDDKVRRRVEARAAALSKTAPAASHTPISHTSRRPYFSFMALTKASVCFSCCSL